MFFRFGLRFCAPRTGRSTPGLSLSGMAVIEGTAQGVTVATVTPTNAKNPGTVSIAAQDIANALQMNVDGVTIEAGSHTLVVGVDTSPFSVTFEYTDDSGAHQFVVQFNIVEANDILDMSGSPIDDMGDAAITDMAA